MIKSYVKIKRINPLGNYLAFFSITKYPPVDFLSHSLSPLSVALPLSLPPSTECCHLLLVTRCSYKHIDTKPTQQARHTGNRGIKPTQTPPHTNPVTPSACTMPWHVTQPANNYDEITNYKWHHQPHPAPKASTRETVDSRLPLRAGVVSVTLLGESEAEL